MYASEEVERPDRINRMTPWTILTFAPLAVCSVVALAVILERVAFYSRSSGLARRDGAALDAALNGGDLQPVFELVRKKRPFFEAAALSLEQSGPASKTLRDETSSLMLQEAAFAMQRRLSGLSTIAVLSPIFGLLGTVAGLMWSFRNIGRSEGPVEPAIIADGLWVALSTTAAGLVIAAVCIVAHTVFSSLVRRRLSEAGFVLNRISLAIERGRPLDVAA